MAIINLLMICNIIKRETSVDFGHSDGQLHLFLAPRGEIQLALEWRDGWHEFDKTTGKGKPFIELPDGSHRTGYRLIPELVLYDFTGQGRPIEQRWRLR